MTYLLLLLLLGFIAQPAVAQDTSLTLKSPAFTTGKMFPVKYSCDGKNVSPEVQWSNAPEGTKAFALILYDTDASFTHWVVYNISAGQHKLQKGIPAKKKPGGGMRQGTNSFKKIGYDGPCPPPNDAAHQYVLTLYALNTKLDLKPGAKRTQVRQAMQGHIIEKAELKAKYKRQ
jgi:Raf kinase inhibitor-like YbhB/YbcL family protein